MRWNKFNSKCWKFAKIIVIDLNLNVSNVNHVLTIFVRENRKKLNKNQRDFKIVIQRDKNFEWIASYYIVVHTFIGCWISNEKNDNDNEKLTKHHVHCTIHWRKKKTYEKIMYKFKSISRTTILHKKIEKFDRNIVEIICEINYSFNSSSLLDRITCIVTCQEFDILCIIEQVSFHLTILCVLFTTFDKL